MHDTQPIPFDYLPPEGPLQVLHVDEDVIVVVKPCGLLSVTGRGEDRQDSLVTRLAAQIRGARIVHRLDLDTSGVMVLARNAEAHRRLSMQFERRETGKAYVARVWGEVAAEAGEVNLPLIVDWPNRPKQKICAVEGRPALTRWSVLRREGPTTLMQLEPVTGRSHQLRVHMLSLGHPIVGDSLYAHEQARLFSPRLELHARDLSFRHPMTGADMAFGTTVPF
ncbi:pseudouridine synthase [Pannonibacter tanglangensis]|uniref:Dual-specificity RNA pseudouridine synthase RluA n=1 Tax=Pannonibacter tanglangensis TaxID=2750084 RepID=A0ABW9ZRD0_9HYPH|nr:pseudouridine synthase [Pannonibacter sp. XCT-34]NBN65280.1 RNA pseudouridine synthase [Pannonibacter sp. XCT-34]